MAAATGPGFIGQVVPTGTDAETVCGCCGAAPLPFCCLCSPNMQFPKYYTAVVTGSGSQAPPFSDPFAWTLAGLPNGTYFFTRCHKAYTTGEPDPTLPPDYWQLLPGDLIPQPCHCNCFWYGFYSPTGSAPWTPFGGPRSAEGPPYYTPPPYAQTITGGLSCQQLGGVGDYWSGVFWSGMRFRYRPWYGAEVREGFYGLQIPTTNPSGADALMTSGGTFIAYDSGLNHPPFGGPPPEVLPTSIFFTPSGGLIDCSAGCSVCARLFGPSQARPATFLFSMDIFTTSFWTGTGGAPCTCALLHPPFPDPNPPADPISKAGYPAGGNGTSMTMTHYALETSIPGLPSAALGTGQYNDTYHASYTDCNGVLTHAFWRCYPQGEFGGGLFDVRQANANGPWETVLGTYTGTGYHTFLDDSPMLWESSVGELYPYAGCTITFRIQEV